MFSLKIFKSQFFKVSLWSGVSSVIKMITGFFSIKVVASIIGPPGIALLGQLSNFITLIGTVSTFGMMPGVTKYVAEYKTDDEERAHSVIKNALNVLIVLSVVISLILLLFASAISQKILYTKEYTYVIRAIAVNVIFFALNLWVAAVINGLKEYKKLITINIINSIVGLVLNCICAFLYGVNGVLISTIFLGLVSFGYTFFFIKKSIWFGHLISFKFKIDAHILKSLAGFSLMAIISGCLVPLTSMIIRNEIISKLSINDAGIWEGINRISATYLMVVTASMATYWMPRLSEIKNVAVLKKEMFKTILHVIPFLILMCGSIFLLRDVIISVLFGDKFVAMRQLFICQVIGDFFKIMATLMAQILWAKAMVKTFIFSEIFFSLFWIVCVKLSLSYLTFSGITVGYMVNYIFYFFFMLFVISRYNG